MKASFTYEVVTAESAEHGEVEARWITPGHWEYPLNDGDGEHPDTLADAQVGEFDITDLATVISFAQELGICSNEGADWLSSVDPDHGDYSTDEQRFYALHLDGVTNSTRKRIFRLITA